MSSSEPSYIDYEAFLSPDFSPDHFANTLVVATNNSSDTPIDLSTPLSRVLFDLQEIDTHINSLTTKSALPLLNHTREQSEASSRILSEVERQLATLTQSYNRLEKEVLQKHRAAEEAYIAAQNSWEALRLGRAVIRCLSLSRQLEAQVIEALPKPPAKEDFSALLRATHTSLQLRTLLDGSSDRSSEGHNLDRINIVKTIKTNLVAPSESRILSKSQQTVREFNISTLSSLSSTPTTTSNLNTSLSSAPTFSQTSLTKSTAIIALTILSLLSEPALLSTLTTYLSNSLTSSLTSVSRSLSTISSNTLPRTLLETSTRCQNIVALETLLSTHPLSLLPRLLAHLDTSSLPSYFWRSLAAGLEPRVAEIVNRGGAQARLLKKERERIRESLRECVLRGSQMPKGVEIGGRGGDKGFVVGGWEREAAVMGAAVLGALGK